MIPSDEFSESCHSLVQALDFTGCPYSFLAQVSYHLDDIRHTTYQCPTSHATRRLSLFTRLLSCLALALS
jgi:hypothetical protein